MRRLLAVAAATTIAGSVAILSAGPVGAHDANGAACGSQSSTAIDTGYRPAQPVENLQPGQTRDARTVALLPDPAKPDKFPTHGLLYLDDRDYVGSADLIDFFVLEIADYALGRDDDFWNSAGHDHSGGMWLIQETNGTTNLQKGGQNGAFHKLESDYPDVAKAINGAYTTLYSSDLTAGDDPCGVGNANGKNGKTNADNVIF